MSRTARVLIADDSATIRRAFRDLLASEPGIAVVGEAVDGMDAVDKAARLCPDVITMDVLMPGLGGLDAIESIMENAPSRILVVSSVADDRSLDLSFLAMSRGALEVIAKPAANVDLRAFGKRLADSIRLMSEVPVVRRRARVAHVPSPRPVSRVEAWGIASSTGGPPALAEILRELPADLGVPIFIAQHMAEGFGSGLVRWLGGEAKLPVVMATDGSVAAPGTVYLAPDGRDLVVSRLGRIETPRSRGGHCPSGDLLLRSIAGAYGNHAAGAVLTGMGEDGARGLLAIRRVGGVTVAQDEASSVVFGMPRAARDLDATSRLMPPSAIAREIAESASPPRAGEEPSGRAP